MFGGVARACARMGSHVRVGVLFVWVLVWFGWRLVLPRTPGAHAVSQWGPGGPHASLIRTCAQLMGQWGRRFGRRDTFSWLAVLHHHHLAACSSLLIESLGLITLVALGRRGQWRCALRNWLNSMCTRAPCTPSAGSAAPRSQPVYGRMAPRATHLDGVMQWGKVVCPFGRGTLGESHGLAVSCSQLQQSGSRWVPYWQRATLRLTSGSSRIPCMHWGENSSIRSTVDMWSSTAQLTTARLSGQTVGHIQASCPHPFNHQMGEEEILDYGEDELQGAAEQQGVEGEQGEQEEEQGEQEEEQGEQEGEQSQQAAAAPGAPARTARLGFANPDRPLAAMCQLPIMAPCGMHPHSNHTNGGCMGQEQWRRAVMHGPHQAVARALVEHQQRERHRHEQHAAQQARTLVHDRIARRQQHPPVPSPPPVHVRFERASQPQLARFRVPSPPPAHERYERAGRRQAARYRSRSRSPPPRPHQPPRHGPRALPAIASPAAPAASPAAPAAAVAAASALPAELSPALLQALAGLHGGAGVVLFLPR